MQSLTGMIGAGLMVFSMMSGSASIASAGQAASAVKVDDSAIESQITASLKKSPSLAPRNIDVDVDHGVVTLTGSVRSAEEKASAATLARVTGVTRVSNELEINPKIDDSKVDAAAAKTKSGLNKAVDSTVKAAEKTKEGVQKGVGKSEQGVGKAAEKTSEAVGKAGDKMSDASVTTRVQAGFSNEALLRDSNIDVDTSNRVVTLRGTVPSTDAKSRAAAVAAGTEGVTRVVNQLIVKGN